MFDGLDLRGCIFGLVAISSVVFFVIGSSIAYYMVSGKNDNMQFKKPLKETKRLYFNEQNEIDTFYIYHFSEPI